MDPDGREDKRGPDLNFFPECETIFYDCQKETRASNVFVVAGHGNENSIYKYPNPVVDENGVIVRGVGVPIPVDKLAELIKQSPNYTEGMTIVLWSCHTGKTKANGLNNYAQKLANALGEGAKVLAPNTSIWFWSNKPKALYDPKTVIRNNEEVDVIDERLPGRMIMFIGE